MKRWLSTPACGVACALLVSSIAGSNDAAATRPIAVYTENGLPNVQAAAAVVLDVGARQVIYSKNAEEVRSIASISKLMAMLVVTSRNLDLDAVTEMTQSDRAVARGGARSRLPVGYKFTNRDLLHAALMASDNRAVPALGRAVGLDTKQLVAAMNARARDLGLANTSFGDPTGIDDQNRSTPRELATLLIEALDVPLIAEITSKATYMARAVNNQKHTVTYYNTDILARGGRYEVLGGKTGYTGRAGYCLAVAARLGCGEALGRRDVAMVLLGARGKLTRFGDFSRIAQWIREKTPFTIKGHSPLGLKSSL